MGVVLPVVPAVPLLPEDEVVPAEEPGLLDIRLPSVPVAVLGLHGGVVPVEVAAGVCLVAGTI